MVRVSKRHLAEVGLFIAAIAFVVTAWLLGVQQGHENEKRSLEPQRYSAQAKQRALATCKQSNKLELFDCVYEQVEAADETARSEQDLTAQQLAANSNMWATIIGFFTMIVSVAGLVFIRKTLVATQDMAVESQRAGAVNLPVLALNSVSANRYDRGDESGHAPATPVQLHLNFVNLGKTVAIIERFYFEHASDPGSRVKKPNLKRYGAHQVDRERYVEPGERYRAEPDWTHVDAIDDVGLVLTRQNALTFYGYIDYSDFLGQWHRLGFSFSWSRTPYGVDDGAGGYVLEFTDREYAYRRILTDKEIDDRL